MFQFSVSFPGLCGQHTFTAWCICHKVSSNTEAFAMDRTSAGAAPKSARLPEFLNPDAPADLLTLIGAALGAEGLLVLGGCCVSLRRVVASPQMTSVWHTLLTRVVDEPFHYDPMARYLELATLNLTGTWLDVGEDVEARERYRFLSAMRQTRQRGLEWKLEAVSQLDDEELKLSRGMLRGTQYVCVERFALESEPKRIFDEGVPVAAFARRHDDGITDLVINIAVGVLQVDNGGTPRIEGFWQQYEFNTFEDAHKTAEEWLDGGFSEQALVQAMARGAQYRTNGAFTFTKLGGVFNPNCARDAELRSRAGLANCEELILLEPFDPGPESESVRTPLVAVDGGAVANQPLISGTPSEVLARFQGGD